MKDPSFSRIKNRVKAKKPINDILTLEREYIKMRMRKSDDKKRET